MRWSPGQPENALAGGNPLDYLAGQIRTSRDWQFAGLAI
jgi:hypothetical protein